jgi:hypothetical protein
LIWNAGGSGITPGAAAPPLFCTTTVAVKLCPRLREPGSVKDEMTSFARSTTVAMLEEVGPAVTPAPELASVPWMEVESDSVPGPVFASARIQVKVALAPGPRSTAAGAETIAAPVPETRGGSGSTETAAVWPVLVATSEAAKLWPTLDRLQV